jgi:putative membrane protein
MGIIWSWIILTVAIILVAYLLPGIRVAGLGSAIFAAAVLGIFNAILKPVLIILTLPLTIVTFGLFLFVLNALLFMLVGAVVQGFRVDSFWWALLGSLLVSVFNYIIQSLI